MQNPQQSLLTTNKQTKAELQIDSVPNQPIISVVYVQPDQNIPKSAKQIQKNKASNNPLFMSLAENNEVHQSGKIKHFKTKQSRSGGIVYQSMGVPGVDDFDQNSNGDKKIFSNSHLVKNSFVSESQFQKSHNLLKQSFAEKPFGKKVVSKLQSAIYLNLQQEWKTQKASISQDAITIGGKSIPVNQITKIKIMKQTAIHNSLKIKLTCQSHDILFSVGAHEQYEEMPLHYYWFAKIINSKLHLKGYGWETHIPVTCYRNSNAYNLIIDGNLFKKSQYFKSWETRYVAITPDGLSSYKQDTGFESFGIKRGTANELWTRFDTHESSLVIKILHNNRKTQFGIPISDYCKDQGQNWLIELYKLIFPD